MKYLGIGAIIIIFLLLIIRIKLKINNQPTTNITLTIGFFKINLSKIIKNKKNNLQETKKDIQKLTSPFIKKILKYIRVDKCYINISLPIEYIYTLFCIQMFCLIINVKLKRTTKKHLQVSIGKTFINYNITLSMSLLKVVTIIINNYSEFKQLIKKEVS